MTGLQLVLWVTSTSGVGGRSKAPAEDEAGAAVRAECLSNFSSFSSANGKKHNERQGRHPILTIQLCGGNIAKGEGVMC